MSEFLGPALISISHHIEKSPKVSAIPVPVQRSPMLTATKKSPYVGAANATLLDDDVFNLDKAAALQPASIVAKLKVPAGAPAPIDTPTAIDMGETLNLRTVVDKDVATALVGDNVGTLKPQ